ncbi:hypothetical protein [uncultured Bacteroides sp.]|uniref:hypothetical protein n=1 Tax=uncultured Bacteroides sp. TaxID=162156 RepID=UPI0025D54672|nr:hypothetical protein [uncultured Bacteroides sp.]
MKRKVLLFSLCLATGFTTGFATDITSSDTDNSTKKTEDTPKKSRLTLGGYGEAVMTRNFYSDNWKRYTDASLYKNADSHGRFDLPHVVLFIGYDFGKGWTMGSEIEFEHGGTESAVEIEEEETGEYESEIERGGEVALEQFWIQKSFLPELNLRMGHIIVPVGLTNGHHMPTEFFGVYRPEGENTILPCTWHETGVSLWGRIKKWRYEVMFLAGLDADRFNNQNWIQGGTGSPYEFKIANSYAGAARIDNYSIPGLRIGVSGYLGKSASNSLKANKFTGLKGMVSIGAVDFGYNAHNWIVRGSFVYGHLENAGKIAESNRSLKGMGISPGTNIGSDAISIGAEAGYDLFSQITKLKEKEQRLYIFGRYDFYNPMYKMGKNTKGQQLLDEGQWGRQRIAGGLNYYPMKEIVVKAEYSCRLFKSQYNNEPSISLGVAYSGFFTK